MATLYFQVQADYQQVTELQKKISDLETQLKGAKLSDPIDKWSASLQKAQAQLDGLLQQAAQAGAGIQQLANAMQNTAGGTQNAATAVNQAANSMAQAASSAQAVNKAAAPAAQSTKDLGDKAKDTRTMLQKFAAEAQHAGGGLAQMTEHSNFAAKAFRQIISAGAAGTVAVMGFTTVLGGIKNAVSTIVDFQAANDTLRAILGQTREEMQEMTNDALELGRATVFTASQVTQLQTELSKLGFSKPEIQSMQESVLQFAQSTGSDLASAASTAGAAVRMFGLQTEDTGKVCSAMSAATMRSALDFRSISENLATFGPMAHSMGMSIEEVLALFGTLKNSGMDASTAMTSLRNIFTKLNKITGMDGVKSFDDFTAAIDRLKAAGDLEGIDGTQKMMKEVGARGGAQMMSLISAGGAKLQELKQQIVDGEAGVMGDMSKAMTDNVAGQIKMLQSAWEGFILTMSVSTGPMQEVLKVITDTINYITDLIKGKSTEETSAGIKMLVTTIGALAAILALYKARLIAVHGVEKARELTSRISMALHKGEVNAMRERLATMQALKGKGVDNIVMMEKEAVAMGRLSKGEAERLRKMLQMQVATGKMTQKEAEQIFALEAERAELLKLKNAQVDRLRNIVESCRAKEAEARAALACAGENEREAAAKNLARAATQRQRAETMLNTAQMEANTLATAKGAGAMGKLKAALAMLTGGMSLMSLGIMAAIALVVAICYAIYKWCTKTDEATQAHKMFKETLQEVNTEVENAKSQVEQYISTIQDETATMRDKIKAYQDLIEVCKQAKGMTMEDFEKMTAEQKAQFVSDFEGEKKKETLESERDAYDAVANRKRKEWINDIEKKVSELETYIDNRERTYSVSSEGEKDAIIIDINKNKELLREYKEDLLHLQSNLNPNNVADTDNFDDYIDSLIKQNKLSEELGKQMKEKMENTDTFTDKFTLLEKLVADINAELFKNERPTLLANMITGFEQVTKKAQETKKLLEEIEKKTGKKYGVDNKLTDRYAEKAGRGEVMQYDKVEEDIRKVNEAIARMTEDAVNTTDGNLKAQLNSLIENEKQKLTFLHGVEGYYENIDGKMKVLQRNYIDMQQAILADNAKLADDMAAKAAVGADKIEAQLERIKEKLLKLGDKGTDTQYFKDVQKSISYFKGLLEGNMKMVDNMLLKVGAKYNDAVKKGASPEVLAGYTAQANKLRALKDRYQQMFDDIDKNCDTQHILEVIANFRADGDWAEFKRQYEELKKELDTPLTINYNFRNANQPEEKTDGRGKKPKFFGVGAFGYSLNGEVNQQAKKFNMGTNSKEEEQKELQAKNDAVDKYYSDPTVTKHFNDKTGKNYKLGEWRTHLKEEKDARKEKQKQKAEEAARKAKEMRQKKAEAVRAAKDKANSVAKGLEDFDTEKEKDLKSKTVTEEIEIAAEGRSKELAMLKDTQRKKQDTLKKERQNTLKNYDNQLKDLYQALDAVQKAQDDANGKIHHTTPWELMTDEQKNKFAEQVRTKSGAAGVLDKAVDINVKYVNGELDFNKQSTISDIYQKRQEILIQKQAKEEQQFYLKAYKDELTEKQKLLEANEYDMNVIRERMAKAANDTERKLWKSTLDLAAVQYKKTLFELKALREKEDKAREKSRMDYFKNYGTPDMQRTAIRSEAEDKRNKEKQAAQIEGREVDVYVMKSIDEEENKSLSNVTANEEKEKIDMALLYSQAKGTTEAVEKSLAALDNFMQTEAFQNLTEEDKKTLYEGRDQLEDKEGNKGLIAAIREHKEAIERYKECVEKQKALDEAYFTALAAYTQAEKDLQNKKDALAIQEAKDYGDIIDAYNKSLRELKDAEERLKAAKKPTAEGEVALGYIEGSKYGAAVKNADNGKGEKYGVEYDKAAKDAREKEAQRDKLRNQYEIDPSEENKTLYENAKKEAETAAAKADKLFAVIIQKAIEKINASGDAQAKKWVETYNSQQTNNDEVEKAQTDLNAARENFDKEAENLVNARKENNTQELATQVANAQGVVDTTAENLQTADKNRKNGKGDTERAANNMERSSRKVAKSWGQAYDAMKKTTGIFEALSEVIGETGQKITGVIAKIADIGIQTSQSVMDSIDAVGKASKAGIKAMSAMEKACLILTIIQAAVQVFTTLFDAFSGSNMDKMNEEIDELKAQISDMKDTIKALKDELQRKGHFGDIIQTYEKIAQLTKKQEENTQQAMKDEAGKWERGSHSISTRLKDNKAFISDLQKVSEITGRTIRDSSDFLSLSAEEMRKVQTDTEGSNVFNDILHQYREEENDHTGSGIDKMIQSYVDEYANAMDELNKELQTELLTFNFEDMQDSFLSSLQDMNSSASDFASNFQSLLNNAVIKAFVADSYKDKIKSLVEDMQNVMQNKSKYGGIVTQADIQSWRYKYNSMVKEALDLRDTMEQVGLVTDTDVYEQQQSRGVGSMSEETAEELNGRFTALQIAGEACRTQSVLQTQALTDIKGSLAILSGVTSLATQATQTMLEQISYSYVELKGINDNTLRTAKNLDAMRETLDDLYFKVKNGI